MIHETNLGWKGGMAFETNLDGHSLTIDAGSQNGGQDKGMRPKKLLLTALAGCTAMDVVMILNKMKVEVEDLNIKTIGDVTDEHPKQYTNIKLVYQFKGKNLDLKKLERAVGLSQNKYCGVSAVLAKAVNLSYEIEILD